MKQDRTLKDFLNAKIYENTIEGEVAKPATFTCFPGAWYYKALSSKDAWLGIEVEVTLPYFIPDENRFKYTNDPTKPGSQYKLYLDTPSIYVGGSSDFESDLGLGWFRGMVDGVVTPDKICYRPFYRYIYLDENGEEINSYQGPAIRETEYYYFPGDTVRMRVFSLKDNYLRLSIELIKETTDEQFVQIRKKLNPNQIYQTDDFPSPGNGCKSAEYKRVNAIDQYGNEGKPAQMTDAEVENCVWGKAYLYREISGEIMKVPFDSSRYIRMMCPLENAFQIEQKDFKEIVSIKPKRANSN